MNVSQIQLIGDIYDAAIDPGRWTGLLDRIAYEACAKGAYVVAIEKHGYTPFMLRKFNSIFSDEFWAEYEEHYQKYEGNPWTHVEESQPGIFLPDSIAWPDRDVFNNRPDIVWAAEKIGIRNRTASKLNDEKAWFDILCVQYADGRGNMTDREEAVAVNFIPHLARTVRLSRGFSLLKARFNAALSALDRYRIGQFMVLKSGALVFSNDTGQAIIDSNNGIGLSADRRIVIHDIKMRNTFAEAIVSASSTAQGEGARNGTTLSIPKRSSGDSYSVEISPLRDTDYEIDKQFRGALVSVIDPDRHHVVLESMDSLYGLTNAEMHVLRSVVDGLSTEEIAESRSVTPGTVRQQIKSILSKTDSRSRTELVRRALTVNLPIDENS